MSRAGHGGGRMVAGFLTTGNMNTQQLFLDSAISTAAVRPIWQTSPELGELGEQLQADRGLEARGAYVAVKPVVEWLAALVLVILTLPVITLAAVATKLVSPGPAFFRQTRVGRHGREFRVWKIRTMVVNAEALTGPIWSVTGDPRVTRLGRFLRNSHIDEFPQLFNVLAGDMALIGPRPERPEFVSHLEWRLPEYRSRLEVRPGITGLAQMLLPADTDLESVRRKLACDLFYIRHLSAWLDFKIALHTAGVFVRAIAVSALRPLRLPCTDSIIGSPALGGRAAD